MSTSRQTSTNRSHSSDVGGEADIRSTADVDAHSHSSSIGVTQARSRPKPSWLPDTDDEAEDDYEELQRGRSEMVGSSSMMQVDSDEDGDDGEAMPSATASMRPSPGDDHGPTEEERALIHDTIVSCYREVWKEFYEWEPQDAVQTLRALATSGPSDFSNAAAASPYALQDGDWVVCTDQNSMLGEQDLTTVSEVQFEVYEWGEEGDLTHRSIAPIVSSVAHLQATVAPHPCYEACTPTYACIDDPEKSSLRPQCRFIKYAGQPGFDAYGYLRKFGSVGWQQPWKDPDCKLIEACAKSHGRHYSVLNSRSLDRVIASVTVQRLTAWTTEEIRPPVPIYVDDIDNSGVFHWAEHQSGSVLHSNSEDFSVSWIMHKMRQR